MARENEADRRPIAAPSGTVGVITKSDTTVISPICSKLFINCTVAGNVAVRLLDGNTVALPVPTGVTVLDIQFDQVLSTGTTATATFVGLYCL